MSGGSQQGAQRGFVLIAGAKLFFIVTSYLIHFALPRIFSTADSFGLYATVMASASVVNNVMIVATAQTVSRFVSGAPEQASSRLRQGLSVQLVAGLVVGGLVYVVAEPFARSVLKDARLIPMLRMLSGVVFSYSLYSAIVGYLNGLRWFLKQATLDFIFSALRVTGIVVGAWVAVGLFADVAKQAFGAVLGFAGAAASILFAGVLLVARDASSHDRKATRVPLQQWLAFMVPLWIYHGALNGMLQLDALVLKGTMGQVLADYGVTLEVAARRSSEIVGKYSAAQKFAFIPYQLVLALTFVTFPLVSRATTAGDEREAKRLVWSALRFSVLVVLAVAGPVSGAASGIMRVAYPDTYLSGAVALEVLAFGIAAFGVFVVAASVINGSGSPLKSAVVGLLGCAILVTLVKLCVASYVKDDTLLLRSVATAATVSMVGAAVVALGVVNHRFAGSIPFATLLRCGVASAASYVVAHYIPQQSPWMSLVAVVAGSATYVALLLATRETTVDEIKSVVERARRPRSQPAE